MRLLPGRHRTGRGLARKPLSNHPFIDGNKRTAFVVTAAFLRVNGFRLNIDDVDAYRFLMQLYENNLFNWQWLEPWLRQHSQPVI